MKRSSLFLSILLLIALAACSSGTTSSTPAPARITPTPAITPTPTIPAVPTRSVHFLTPDHIQLAGLLYGQGKTAVICSHELRATKAIWGLTGIAQRLVQHGYAVLAYDFRGNGDSAGTADTSKNDIDLRAAIAFMRQQGATKIVLLGSSMGGTATLKVAAHEQVAALATLSAPQDFGTPVSDAEVKSISAPKLFINSQDDTYASDTQHMYDIASQPKELHLYSGGAHGIVIFYGDYGSDLTQRILNFFARYAPAD
jgi:esterase/lipase